jgi:zinc/manganese transport system substrate-binding protein/manganese/iron transport system substrate-binding protein
VPASPEPDALRVVATTTVLADLVKNVGGTKVVVDSVVPKGGEPHTFDPTPADITKVADAELIVMNGVGLDEWLGDLISDAGAADTPIVELGEDLDGVTYLEGEEHEGEGHEGEGHAGEEFNPHLWLNVAYAQKYVEKLTEALKSADPADATTYDANAMAYQARLTELDTWVRQQIDTIPAADRKIVSFHEAFPYFAAAYGLEIVGVAVEAPGQEPSAGEIADLIDAIRESGVKAIFSEAQFPTDLVDQIAAETGATVEADLYNDSLGDPPADTYEGMIRYDVEKIVAALT